MRLGNKVPKWLSESVIIKRNKKRFPNSNINTHRIAESVSIESNCRIANNVFLGSDVNIDKYTYINDDSMVGVNVKIGKFCSIAYGCKIGLHEHPTNYISTSPYIYGDKNIFGSSKKWEDHQKETIIQNDVWIGSNTIIIQGVNIGNGAIIGAGSVVTKNVDPYTIVGGVPAKTIKKRFDLETIEKLQAIKWWEWDEDKMKKNKKMFLSKDKWIELYNKL